MLKLETKDTKDESLLQQFKTNNHDFLQISSSMGHLSRKELRVYTTAEYEIFRASDSGLCP
jgi:hypothetical protein